ncbi:hypothetical protein QR98_0099750, partial [Sarcoptes scabiei]
AAIEEEDEDPRIKQKIDLNLIIREEDLEQALIKVEDKNPVPAIEDEDLVMAIEAEDPVLAIEAEDPVLAIEAE